MPTLTLVGYVYGILAITHVAITSYYVVLMLKRYSRTRKPETLICTGYIFCLGSIMVGVSISFLLILFTGNNISIKTHSFLSYSGTFLLGVFATVITIKILYPKLTNLAVTINGLVGVIGLYMLY